MLSFSWNCDVMVPSAASQGATRPSYFGPDSQKFSSSGLAAVAGPNDASPNSVAIAAHRPRFFKEWLRSRMGNPRYDRALDRAAKPAQGQVQPGNSVGTSRWKVGTARFANSGNRVLALVPYFSCHMLRLNVRRPKGS